MRISSVIYMLQWEFLFLLTWTLNIQWFKLKKNVVCNVIDEIYTKIEILNASRIKNDDPFRDGKIDFIR